MLKPKFTPLALLALAAAVFAPPALAVLPGVGDSLGYSPFANYKTIETDHFRINFPEELSATAQKTANYLEEAHHVLSQFLYWEASYKVNINILDNQDSENGLTTPELRFGITLFVTPPDNWTSTAYYDNWLRLLCFHEYTHFLNMDATRDFYKVLRYFFGDTLLPNTVWPSWMLEGLAVYDETRFTHGGRGLSPYYDMILRASVQEKVLDTRDFITLDKVNGPNPYYPGGETVYLFGYELMNQETKYRESGPTADGKGGPLKSGEDVLGIMSARSSWRVPFFINGNLENISGKNWYDAWDDFVAKTRSHAEKQLATIRSQPVTQFKRLTHNSYEAYGPTLSPDGQWIAYTLDGLDDISGLFLLNRKTGKRVRLLDKEGGVSLAFSHDSRYLFESRLHRIRNYYLYSDIEVLNLEDGTTHWLTFNQRARDPSLSPDNREITFTRTQNSTTQLVIGELKFDGSRYSMGSTRVLYAGKKFDRVSSPQFSPDGNQIAFSVHTNGAVGEDVLLVDLKKNTIYTVVRDQSLNRYPAWDAQGNLYYVSDKTGVDNLYRFRFGQVSNFETGVAFPSFSKHLGPDKYLAAVFSTHGWDMAEVELPKKPYSAATLEVERPDGPARDEQSDDHSENKTYAVKDYSLWPTILPRSWAPFAEITNVGAYIGGEVYGFDQVDRHRYLLLGAYDTFVKKGDYYGVYDNRVLGVTLEASAYQYTSAEYSNGNTLYAYNRTQTYALTAYYPFQSTYWTLTPAINYNFTRQLDYFVNPSGGPDIVVGETQLVPNLSGMITYTDIENSRLAVFPESGRTIIAGERVYMNSGDNNFKGLAADYENIEFGSSHIVLAPTLKGSWASHNDSYQPSDVLVQGRYSNNALSAILLPGDSFDHLGIRGYPLQAYYTKAAAVASADLRFPLWRVNAGPGTDPLFISNLWGFGFVEDTYFPAKDQVATTLPSTGAGVHLGLSIAQYIPVDLSVQYNYGFNTAAGGTGEVFALAGINLSLP
jgi:hypothetical protein